MTDKIEEIRKAMEGACEGPWRVSTDHWGHVDVVSFLGLVVAEEAGPDAPLIALAPDMARIVLAAMPILQWSDDMTTQAAASGEVWHEPAPIAAFRKAVEEKTDD